MDPKPPRPQVNSLPPAEAMSRPYYDRGITHEIIVLPAFTEPAGFTSRTYRLEKRPNYCAIVRNITVRVGDTAGDATGQSFSFTISPDDFVGAQGITLKFASAIAPTAPWIADYQASIGAVIQTKATADNLLWLEPLPELWLPCGANLTFAIDSDASGDLQVGPQTILVSYQRMNS